MTMDGRGGRLKHLAEIQNILAGLPVSHVWWDYGSAIFWEFGELRRRVRRDGSLRNPKGQVTLMIEWRWQIENPYSILAGSWNSELQWPKAFRGLLKAQVTNVVLLGELPELYVSLSNGKRVVSFMTTEGQPAWALVSRRVPLGSWRVKRGKIQFIKDPPLRSQQ